MRWFDPQIMPTEHFHGHIELNWLTAGNMDYRLDAKEVRIPSERLVMFWAGIPHQTVALDRGARRDARQCTAGDMEFDANGDVPGMIEWFTVDNDQVKDQGLIP